MGSEEKSSKNKKIPTRQDEMSHPVGVPKSRFLLQQCSLLCFPFPDHQRVCRFFLSLFSMVPNAESVDLPAVHQHLDRFIRIASTESDESHQRSAVSGAGQLDSKIRRVGDHITVNDSFLDECEVNALFKFQEIRSLFHPVCTHLSFSTPDVTQDFAPCLAAKVTQAAFICIQTIDIQLHAGLVDFGQGFQAADEKVVVVLHLRKKLFFLAELLPFVHFLIQTLPQIIHQSFVGINLRAGFLAATLPLFFWVV